MTREAIDPTHFGAALFDMDGVVIDSEPLSARIMQEAARSFDFDVPDEAMASFKGLPGDVVYARVATDFGRGRVDGPTLRSVRDRMYEAALDGVPLMPGFRDVLERMASRGWPMALVTSSRRRHAEMVLEVHDLVAYFTAVLGSEDVVRPKPAPDPYREAADRLGIAASRCIAVEDSVNGVRSASGAGCCVVGFGTDFPAADLLGAGADLLCRDHHALIRLVGP